jgi:transposase InsO family protein
LVQHTAFSLSVYPLKNSAILDSGTTIHIFNQITRFLNFRTALPGDFVYAGNSQVPIKGYGEVDIHVSESQQQQHILRLYDVAFCEGFACNLVSLRQLHRQGYWWDNKSPNNALRSKDNTLVCHLVDSQDQFVLEHIPEDLSRASFYARRQKYNSWTQKPPATADFRTWHLRLGHPGPEALNHLVGHSQGVRIKGQSTTECDACGRSKIKRQISRTARRQPERPAIQLAIDFHDFEPSDFKAGDLKYSSVMLVTDRFSDHIWDFYLTNRRANTIVTALEWLLRILERQFQVKPEAIESDNELQQSHQFRDFIKTHGLRFEPSAPNTQSQNGGAERSGGIIKEKARAMRDSSKLPAFLWPEIVRTAVYLYNRTPKYKHNWKSPYERFFTFLAYRDGIVAHERKPKQQHLRVFGCKAYAMTSDAQLKKNRRQKLNPKAWIGYLVGYNSTNIFRIWNPSTNNIIVTRDVIFDEKQVFTGDIQQLKDDLLHISANELEAVVSSIEIQTQSTELSYTTQTEDEDLNAAVGDVNARESGKWNSESSDNTTDKGSDLLSEFKPDQPDSLEQYVPYLTPEATPFPPAALLATAIRSSGVHRKEEAKDQLPKSTLGCCFGQEEAQDQLSKQAYRPYSMSNAKYSNWRTAFNAGRLVNVLGTYKGETVSKAKLVRTTKNLSSCPGSEALSLSGTRQVKPAQSKSALLEKLKAGKCYRRELPPLPKTHKDLANHLLGEQFKVAEKDHLSSHRIANTWYEVRKQKAVEKELLDCMWVYVYKFDKHGRLVKCKARLVIRGDQQAKSEEETYASTLAGRSFRTLMAIAARFDLELIQYDVVNAFVNAELTQEIYMRLPPGYRKEGTVLRLRKALYGLRQAPILWKNHFSATLTAIGFCPVPHEPCCYSKDGILLFFYVDDIVSAFEKSKKDQADYLIKQLKDKYYMTGGEALQWFLGIEVLRDRENRLIRLSQASFIDKMAKLASHDKSRPETPMRTTELLPYEGRASYSSITQYQRKVGSLLYAAVITRPDIAFATSRLARFNCNPGPEHHKESDRVIRYLVKTQGLALQYGNSDVFEVASDASFADNSIDRKSSQAYAMKLFGGTIGWRANKQDTVTTSTTEAELLALSQAAKEAIYVSRLVKELGVTLDDAQIDIKCDNKQTIRLVNADIAVLQTKLRHVDIHNHWLRQEAAAKRIRVSYTPTDSMIADGLTKSLTARKHQQFVRQIGLVDIQKELEERKHSRLQQDFFDQVENTFVGGEAAIQFQAI